MRITRLHYVFSFLFLLFICLSQSGFAQKTGKTQQGSATWYGSKYHGRPTTSGEIYNKNKMTAAHPSLPFGTKVKVTNIADHTSVIVRINDRGPFGKKGYIIDLSEAAAKKIQLHRSGYGKVKIEVLSPGTLLEEETDPVAIQTPAADSSQTLADSPYFIIQAGAFSDEANAKLQSEKLKTFDLNLPVALKEELINGKKIHRVVAGHFTSRTTAEEFKAKLQKKGIAVLVKQVPSAS